MSKQIRLVLIAAGALTFALGCGSNGEKTDGKVNKTDGIKKTDGAVITLPDGSAGSEGIAMPDKSTTSPDMPATSCTPAAATTNSGAICTASQPCPNPATEMCVAFAAGAQKGMCLGKCCPNMQNPQDPVNICPVADSANQMSFCDLGGKDPVSGAVQNLCGFLCEFPDPQNPTSKITKACPNTTDYKCESLPGSTQPDYKYCQPV